MVTPYERNGPALLHVHVQHLELRAAVCDARCSQIIIYLPSPSGNFDLAQKEISTRHRFWGGYSDTR
jgi:hypothetical protein